MVRDEISQMDYVELLEYLGMDEIEAGEYEYDDLLEMAYEEEE